MKNACIVGYGAIGPVHADAIDKCPDAHLYAVCEIDTDRAKKCTDAYSGVIWYADFDKMLCDSNIDVVHICTPHYLHEPMTKAALCAGKDVVLEKPVCMNRDEMNGIVDTAESHSDRRVCVMLQNRTNACIRKMQSIGASGDAGELMGIIATLSWHRDEKYYAHDSWHGIYEKICLAVRTVRPHGDEQRVIIVCNIAHHIGIRPERSKHQCRSENCRSFANPHLFHSVLIRIPAEASLHRAQRTPPRLSVICVWVQGKDCLS